jgi:Fic family protein
VSTPATIPTDEAGGPPRRALAIELHDDQINAVLEHASEARRELWELIMTAVRDPLSIEDGRLDSSKVSHTLLRGLWLLVRIQAHGEWIGVNELATVTGMKSSTVHRYLTTLLAFGLIERHGHSRRYRARPLPAALS